MARCKLIASSLLVLVMLPRSAAAQSEPISEQYVYFAGKHVDLAPGTISQRLKLYPSVDDDPEPFADLYEHLCTDSANRCNFTVDDSGTQGTEGEANAETTQNQTPSTNNPKEVELQDVIFNETGGLRADPKAKPGSPGSAENLHDARVAVAEVAERVLESNHPEREQAPHSLTHETVRDLNAGNKDVAKALNDSLSAARSRSDTTKGAMHFRTGRHKFKSLYGRKGTMYFGPFHDVTGGKRYLTVAP
jgi:hypothetical protein